MSRKFSTLIAFVSILFAGVALVLVEINCFSPAARLRTVAALERDGSWENLAAMLGDSDPDVRSAASDALVRGGEACVPALVAALDRGDAELRFQAVFALGRLGSAARQALPTLRDKIMSDPDDRVREEAGRAFGRAVRDNPQEVADLLRRLESGEGADRIAAARAVPNLTVEDRRRAVLALAVGLSHPEPRVREECAEALSRLGADARPAVPALLVALTDADERVRDEASEALERLARAPDLGDHALADRILQAIAAARVHSGLK